MTDLLVLLRQVLQHINAYKGPIAVKIHDKKSYETQTVNKTVVD